MILVLVYLVLVALYYLTMTCIAFDGMFRQLMGHTHEHQNVHRLIWNFHTGAHISPQRSYGDERRLRRTASSSNRATPEGAIVYYARRPRGVRAALRNVLVLGVILSLEILAIAPRVFVQIVTVTVITGIFCTIWAAVYRMRKVYAGRTRTVTVKPFARAPANVPSPVKQEQKSTIYVTGGMLDEKPALDGGVPVPVMATLLSGEIGCSAAETATRLKIGADKGSLLLPDHFPALARQREVIEEIVSAQTKGKVSFSWETSTVPRTLSWVPVISSLPRFVRFRDHLADLQRLPPGVFGVGLTMNRTVYAVSHGGDTPWHLRSAGSGTGKSTGFMVKAAQICHNDPKADVYCVDTKQVSFVDLRGIPGVHIFDDPADDMPGIWRMFFMLENLMRDRYTALRTGAKKLDDFNDAWLLVDEGNDLANHLRVYYQKYIKKTGDPAQPTIWIDAIAPLINLGRQVKIRGEWMFQNMTDRVLGGVSLRDAFGVVGMAGYKKNQFSRIIGTSPVPECKNGPGKILMIDGPDQTWVQGFCDEPEYLRAYAMARR